MQTVRAHIEEKQDVCGGKPCIAGTRIRVQDIYIWHELDGRSADEIVTSFPHITHADVYAALAYFWDHRETVLADLRQQEEFVAQMKARTGPGPLEAKLKGMSGANDPVSSG